MSTSRTETVPGAWDDARDEAFFRTTARLFPPQFCLGATVLLASYDDEVDGRPTEPASEVVGTSQVRGTRAGASASSAVTGR